MTDLTDIARLLCEQNDLLRRIDDSVDQLRCEAQSGLQLVGERCLIPSWPVGSAEPLRFRSGPEGCR